MKFVNLALKLGNLEKKDEYPSGVISRIIDSERSGYLNV